jgi:Rod binding domain-containing protein
MDVAAISSQVSSSAAMPSLLQRPSKMSGLSPAEQAKAVSGQFEAIMLRQFLQDSVGSMMGGKEGGASGNVYGYLLTDTLASKLAQGGGLGLAGILQKQLTPRGAAQATAAATPPAQP